MKDIKLLRLPALQQGDAFYMRASGEHVGRGDFSCRVALFGEAL